MKNKKLNFIIYIMFFVIIFASFVVPNKLFEIQDKGFEIAIYSESNSKGNEISVEAENIYLVKALHDIESENTGVAIEYPSLVTISTGAIEKPSKILKLKSEFEVLKQYNIIKDDEILDDSKLMATIVKKVYKKNEESYTIYNVALSTDSTNYQVDIEEKTGKIVRIIMDEENLNEPVEKKQILENYIKYLDLYIIDDWIYDNNMMKSKKADISVSLVENVNNGVNILSIHSNETISENLIEYVDT